MSKKIIVPTKPQPANASDWITRSEASPAPQLVTAEPVPQPEEQLVRLTFDIPEALHRRIKVALAQKGIKRMAVELRRILEENFPVTS
jgi:hypothetical protein